MERKKNLIVIHLESINMLSFLYHASCFPKINGLKEKSKFYTRYYSTATSTFMVRTDLFYGKSVFEDVKRFSDVYTTHVNSPSIFDILSEDGYRCIVYYLGTDIKPNEFEKYFRAITRSAELYNYGDDYNGLIRGVESLCEGNRKFAIYISNNKPHISYIDEFENKDFSGYTNRYRIVDDMVGDVVEVLEKSHRLDDTVLILYGDHGDDFFSHGLHDGYLHATPPIPLLTHCPLIVYNGKEKETCDSIVCTYDIGEIIDSELKNEDMKYSREYVFSRNLFAAQSLQVNSLNKGYSLTDGNYTLLVTSQGLKMYINEIDFGCSCNLLDFFSLARGNLKYQYKYDFLLGTHFHYIFNNASIERIRSRYTDLHNILENYVESLYYGDSPMDFTKINYNKEPSSLKFHLRIRAMMFNIKQILKRYIGYERCLNIKKLFNVLKA